MKTIFPLFRCLILLDLIILFAGILLLRFLWPTINGERFKMTDYKLPWMAVFLVITLILLFISSFLIWQDIRGFLLKKHPGGGFLITFILLIPVVVLSVAYLQIFSETRSMLFMKAEKNYTLPELLMMENGSPVSDIKMWENKRRPEILKLFTNNI